MASSWKDLKDAIQQWQDERTARALDYQKETATELRDGILEALSQKDVNRRNLANKVDKNPIGGLSTLMKSVIIDEDGDGLETKVSVRIEDPSKKDETTGMEIGKIAKAIEFGSSRNAPRPAWRRSLAKMRAKGVFNKE